MAHGVIFQLCNKAKLYAVHDRQLLRQHGQAVGLNILLSGAAVLQKNSFIAPAMTVLDTARNCSVHTPSYETETEGSQPARKADHQSPSSVKVENATLALTTCQHTRPSVGGHNHEGCLDTSVHSEMSDLQPKPQYKCSGEEHFTAPRGLCQECLAISNFAISCYCNRNIKR
jgi:hypothetical protein